MHQGLLFYLAVAASLAVAGCSGAGMTSDSRTAIEPLYQDSQCASPSSQPSATWIDEQNALAEAYQRLQRQQLGNQTSPPAVDFEQAGVLVVDMGQRNTAGYVLELMEPHLRVEDDTARVSLRWNAPAEDAITAQVITSPCLLLEIPRGGFSSLQVLDQQGDIRVTAPVPDR